MEASFLDEWVDGVGFLSNDLRNSKLLDMKNAGGEGTGKVVEKLLSMRTTEAIVGRSVAFSWTHNRPMWMHLKMSAWEAVPDINTGSMMLVAVPSCQFLHACASVRLPLVRYQTSMFIRWKYGMFYPRTYETNQHVSSILPIPERVVLPSANNFKNQHAKAKDICFHRDSSMICVFWCHVSTAIAKL